MTKVALVTGAYKGIGLEVVKEMSDKGYKVLLTSRKKSEGEKAANDLKAQGHDVSYKYLDINDTESLDTLVRDIDKEFGQLDVLINNGAILLDKEKRADKAMLMDTFETNVVGAYLLTEKFFPLLKKSDAARVVNVSSGMGQLSVMSSDYPSYRISKTALNAVTRIFAALGSKHHILVNSVCPGWVKTDMGGDSAPRSLQEGAQGIVWAATLPNEGPTGGFFRDGKSLPW